MKDNKNDNEILDKIEQRKFTYQKKQSLVINNFFTIITITIVSLTILWYINFIYPNYK